MRIALLNKLFARNGGGGERYSWSLAGRLAELGHEVHAFCGAYLEPQPGVIIHPVPYAKFPRFRRITSFASAAARELRLHRTLHFDATYALAPVYGADFFYMGGGSYQHWLRIRRPNPVSRWFHAAINPSSLAQIHVEQRVMRETPCVIAISELVKRHAMELGVPGERVEVVYTGYFEDEFNGTQHDALRQRFRASAGISPETPAGLLIGNFWHRKGLDVTLQALAQIAGELPDFRLLVVGKGDETKYRRLARQLGVEQQVLFLGPTREPAAAFHAADFQIFPGMYDPGGAVILESMACATPVIASALCGNAELIEDGRTGYLLPDPSDSRFLAQCIRELAGDPEKTRRMAQAAAAAAQAHSFGNVVEKLLAIFSRSAAKSDMK